MKLMTRLCATASIALLISTTAFASVEECAELADERDALIEAIHDGEESVHDAIAAHEDDWDERLQEKVDDVVATYETELEQLGIELADEVRALEQRRDEELAWIEDRAGDEERVLRALQEVALAAGEYGVAMELEEKLAALCEQVEQNVAEVEDAFRVDLHRLETCFERKARKIKHMYKADLRDAAISTRRNFRDDMIVLVAPDLHDMKVDLRDVQEEMDRMECWAY